MAAVTCFKKTALGNALQVVFNAHPSWGKKEDLDAFKKTGDLSACSLDVVLKDLDAATALTLPLHPVAFVNGTMLLGKATKEDVMRLSGFKLE
jgi:hypothetical protein